MIDLARPSKVRDLPPHVPTLWLSLDVLAERHGRATRERFVEPPSPDVRPVAALPAQALERILEEEPERWDGLA